jgi:hypothetical protein
MTRRRTPILALVLSILAAGAAAADSSARWTGTVAAVSADDLSLVGITEHFRLAGGATESLSGKPVPAANLAPGSSVTLRVGPREADGRLRVDALEVQTKSPMSLTGQITGISDDRRHLEVHGVEIELDDHTAFSGRAGAVIGRSARSLAPGLTVRVELMPAVSGILRASAVRFSNAEGDPNEDEEIKGTVTAISDASWTIDGRDFLITEDTLFEGDPHVGDFVEVKFHLDADGHAVADRIEREDAPDAEVEFTGVVEAIGDASWTISGHVVAVGAGTTIDGAPAVGDTVEVHAVTLADGTLSATRIAKEDPNANDNPGDDHGNDGPGDDNGQQTGPDDHGQNPGNDDSGNHSGSGNTTPSNSGGHNGSHPGDDGSDD